MRGVLDIRAFRLQKSSLSIVGGQLARQPRTGQLEIGTLAFRCPVTLLDIETGIETDRCTLSSDWTVQRAGALSGLPASS